SVSDPVWQTTKHRFIWLLVNLGTAILASWVISLFDATIQQMVALAVLMPIVASMGGNAGTQTMTVAVRALATQDLGAVNAVRVIGRETIVGLLNGLIFALIMGVIAFYWFGSGQLGVVIGAAMIINLLVAALSGILIPLGLHALDLDPAIASGVFVTMMTDCVGFFAFLGLAALWLTWRRAHVLLSRQGAVVSAATVHADRAAHRVWRDPDLDRLGALGTPLRHHGRHPPAGGGPLAARQCAHPAAGKPLPAHRPRSAAGADRIYCARRCRGQAGRKNAQGADAE